MNGVARSYDAGFRSLRSPASAEWSRSPRLADEDGRAASHQHKSRARGAS